MWFVASRCRDHIRISASTSSLTGLQNKETDLSLQGFLNVLLGKPLCPTPPCQSYNSASQPTRGSRSKTGRSLLNIKYLRITAFFGLLGGHGRLR